jgi:MmyB-like transcription regulator ligand binding domain
MDFTMVRTRPAGQQRELGDFVRAQREKLKPAALGLPAGARRRTPGLRREEVAQSIGSPAYILDRGWTARSWNANAERLFVGWLDRPGDRNLLRFIFLTPAARSLICDYEERARRVVAEFRANVSTHLNDPAIRDLIGDLRRQSREFAQFWEEHGVLGREGGERTFNHPTDGFLRFEQVTFNLASRSDVKLTILVQAAADTAGPPNSCGS